MLEDAPTLSPFGVLAVTAWRDLCGERAVGFALGPIPWRAIVAWCTRYRVPDAESLTELVQSFDAEFLKDANANAGSRPRDSETAKGPGRNQPATVRARGHEKH